MLGGETSFIPILCKNRQESPEADGFPSDLYLVCEMKVENNRVINDVSLRQCTGTHMYAFQEGNDRLKPSKIIKANRINKSPVSVKPQVFYLAFTSVILKRTPTKQTLHFTPRSHLSFSHCGCQVKPIEGHITERHHQSM